MVFVYRVLLILKALWIVLFETHQYFENLQQIKIYVIPWKFDHGFMYIAPSALWWLFFAEP